MAYPQRVEEYINDMFKIIDMDLTEEPFNDEEFKEFLRINLSEKSTQMLIDEGEPNISEEIFEDTFNKTYLEYTLKSMERDGLVGIVEDENGEERFFLTDIGKGVAENLEKNI